MLILHWRGAARLRNHHQFYLLIKATDSLPVGTVYAVFTGLGTAGTVLSEILLFKEHRSGENRADRRFADRCHRIKAGHTG